MDSPRPLTPEEVAAQEELAGLLHDFLAPAKPERPKGERNEFLLGACRDAAGKLIERFVMTPRAIGE